MKTIDTHAHLYLEHFESDIDEVVLRAKSAGVERVLLPNIDTETIAALKRLASSYSNFFIPMMGLHPTSVKPDDWETQLEQIHQELNHGNYIAVGETGLDLYWDKSTLEIQQKAFETQLRWSIDKKLPVVIHSRDATMEAIESVRKVGEDKLFGVFHSFGGNRQELEEILKLSGFYIGINGVVTFKNSGLKEILHLCPLDRLIIETDSPYLAPVPYRGKRNESSFLKDIVKVVAQAYQLSEKVIAERTTQNAYKLFGISQFDKA